MSRDLTVLQSLKGVRPTTNPYLVILGRELRRLPAFRLLDFSYGTALGRSYDVFHVHWPEILLDGSTFPRKLARQLLLVALLARLTLFRVPIVRTVHNIQRPAGLRWA